METRILIPNGLRVVVVEKGARKTCGGGGGGGCSSGAETAEENDKDEEEKPSSSSGYFETGSCKRRPRTRSTSKLISQQEEDGENSSSNEEVEDEKNKRNFSEFATSSTRSSAASTPSSGNEATDFSEQEIIGSSSRVEKERKRRRKRRNPETVNNKAKKNFYSTQVKICADRVIEKGTVFTANEGDVQVINLHDVPAIPKEDVRFLFGGFETITPLPGGSTPSPPPQISSGSGSGTTDSTSTPTPTRANSTSGGYHCNLVRLCNWIRFLRRGGGGHKTPKTSSATTTTISHLSDDEDNSHQSDPDFPSNNNNNNRNESFLTTKKPTSKEMSDSHYHNLVDWCKSNNVNIFGRILDGRPIFEVTRTLVPGTELLVDFPFHQQAKAKTKTSSNMDFHMMDILTQQQNPTSAPSSFSTSPFFPAMMIPRNIQMMMAAGTPPLALNNMNFNFNSSSAAAAAFLLNSSMPTPTSTSTSTPTPISTPTSTSTFAPFLSADYFNLKNYMGLGGFENLHYESENYENSAENEKSLENMKKRENDEKRQFFPFYQNHNHSHSHLHNYPNVHLHPSSFAFNFYPQNSQPSPYENCRAGEKTEVKIKQEKGVGTGAFLDAPLDLSKLHEVATAEPLLKVGTPFDSPDSNEDEDLKGFGRIKQESLGNEGKGNAGSCGSSTLFSIRNVLKNQLSPPPSAKLFQPYGTDIGIGKDFRGNLRHPGIPGAGTPSTPTTTSATTTSAAVTITQRHSPALRPILRTRGRERSLLPCEVCGKAFDRPSLLKRHLRTHTGEKPHICDVCSKGFSTSSSLNTHRRIHSGEKPHQCPICGKRFTASSNLYYHRMTHNKEKPHKCLLCGKSFPTPGDLKSHQYVHSGSWPYSCPVCQRGFSKQTNLRNHLLLHSGGGGGGGGGPAAIGLTLTTSSFKGGEKPHTCGVCDKKFTLACNLRAHMRMHQQQQQHFSADPDSESSHYSGSSKCIGCKQTARTVFNGYCQDCYLGVRRQQGEIMTPTSKNPTPPIPHPPPASAAPSQSEKSKMGNIFQLQSQQSHLECHSSSKGNSSSSPSLSSGPIPSLTSQQQQPQPLATLPMTALPLPQLPGFGFPGIPEAGAAAAGVWNPANLFGATTRGREISGNPLLAQLLEWNLRFAKETAGMNIMHQKLLESQVFAAQLMSTHGFGMGMPGSGASALQEILRLRSTAAAAASDGISHQLNGVGVGIASSENNFMQH